MRKKCAKQFLLLCLPTVFLVALPFIHPAEPTLQLKSVHFKPARSKFNGKIKKGELSVEVFTEYHNSSILARFTEEPGLWFNIHHGLYIEDEHGVRYGKGYPSRDTETYRSFVNKYGERYFERK